MSAPGVKAEEPVQTISEHRGAVKERDDLEGQLRAIGDVIGQPAVSPPIVRQPDPDDTPQTAEAMTIRTLAESDANQRATVRSYRELLQLALDLASVRERQITRLRQALTGCMARLRAAESPVTERRESVA